MTRTFASRLGRESSEAASAARPRHRESSPTGLLQRFWQAGNRALQRLLRPPDAGRELPGAVRREMEARFEIELAGVRLHDGTETSRALDDIGAEAAATREAIHLPRGTDVRSEAGARLLAHELAHVKQARRGGVTGEASAASSVRLEAAATHAGHRRARGSGDAAVSAPAAPAVQFQFKQPDAVGRPQVVQELTAFLRRVQRAQGGKSLQITEPVRDALRMLALARRPGDKPPAPGTVLSMDLLLANDAMIPRHPKRLARRAAKVLPSPFSRSALARLERMALVPGQLHSPLERVVGMIGKSGAGSPEAAERAEANKLARGEGKPGVRTPRRPTSDPGVPTAEQRADEIASIGHAMRGEEQPSGFGPIALPVLQIARISQGIGAAIEEPEIPSPQPRPHPSVNKVIATIPRQALIPGALRGTAEADSFADARVMAVDLARRLDLAQQEDRGTVSLRLGANYQKVKDRVRIIGEIEKIVKQIASALPHKASKVDRVLVYFGDRIYRTVRLRKP